MTTFLLQFLFFNPHITACLGTIQATLSCHYLSAGVPLSDISVIVSSIVFPDAQQLTLTVVPMETYGYCLAKEQQ